MNDDFPRIITLQRKERKISQKKAATDLGISQALLSHYEKGIRECGLDFLVRIADYYNVSCDYLLGRTSEPTQTMGHINGNNSVQNIQDSPVTNYQTSHEDGTDDVTREFIKVFEGLNFDDKVELMGLAVKMRKGA